MINHPAACVCLFFFFNDTATTEIYPLPYTTLFRSHEPTFQRLVGVALVTKAKLVKDLGNRAAHEARTIPAADRSEEHTSELQSPDHLVCRLLLEKKKKKNNLSIALACTHIITSIVC